MVLDAAEIENSMQSVFAGKIVVVSSGVVPPSCLAAFSAVGAVAVISCSSQEQENPNTGHSRSFSAFWARFYSELQGGTDVAMALKRAEESEPALDGAFKINI